MDSVTDSDTCDWKNEYHELRKYAEKVATQIESLKLNEKNLMAKLEEWKEYKECIQSELCTLRAKMGENRGVIEKLKADLAAKEEELCDVREKLKYACDRLRAEFDRQKAAALSDAKGRDGQVEKKGGFERKRGEENYSEFRAPPPPLCSEFEKACEKLRETAAALDEAKETILKEVLNIENSVAAIGKSVGGGREENDRCAGLALELRKLKEASEAKDARLRRARDRIEELRRQNERSVCTVDEQRKRLAQLSRISKRIVALQTESEDELFQRLPTETTRRRTNDTRCDT